MNPSKLEENRKKLLSLFNGLLLLTQTTNMFRVSKTKSQLCSKTVSKALAHRNLLLTIFAFRYPRLHHVFSAQGSVQRVHFESAGKRPNSYEATFRQALRANRDLREHRYAWWVYHDYAEMLPKHQEYTTRWLVHWEYSRLGKEDASSYSHGLRLWK